MSTGKRVLCVCFGNTCRSPMMAALLGEQFELLKATVHVESAGTNKSSEGQDACIHSIEEMNHRHLDISKHVSRHIGSIGLLTQFDAILTVDDKISAAVRELCPDVSDRIIVVNAEAGGIPNPWKLGPTAYTDCAKTIETAMHTIARELATKWS